MSGIISPFQMIYNKVVEFRIVQYDQLPEYDTTSVNLGADFIISDFVNENEKYKAKLNLNIILVGETDKGEKVFDISLNMLGLFHGDVNELEEGKFVEMLKINGISTLMQLSRAYVTSATALSGFSSPVNFPMVNVYKLIELKEKIEEDEEK